ncbi:MAG: branched-chain amino acid aminotransferase [Fibrobacterota bacterium]
MPGKKIDFDNLTFSLTPTRSMFISRCKADGKWDKGAYKPYGNISISPAAGVLNYGQGLFEGLKALRTKTGKIVLFRPLENGKRLADGARRICMPEYPPEKFVEVVKKIVKLNKAFIPPYGKGSLYLRPCLWGVGGILGVSPAPEYMFMVFASPVGPYFKTGFKPVKLEITRDFHRAAGKGTGGVKFIGNYAGGMLPAKMTKAKGFNECIYLDSKEERFIEEVGAANFFCVKGNTVLTPKLGSILPGITRASVIRIAREVMKMEVRETPVSVEDALSADECFCSGTAAVVSSIGSITVDGKETVFNGFNVGRVTQELYDHLTRIQRCEEEDRFGWVVLVK